MNKWIEFKMRMEAIVLGVEHLIEWSYNAEVVYAN